MHSFTTRVVVVVSAIAAVISLSGNPATAATDTQLGTTLDAIVEAGAPGAVGNVRTDTSSSSDARGVANILDGTPATTDDAFRIASITKPMVATAVMQLHEQHKLDLDDSLESLLPGLVPNANAITVRNLLSHTSGLPEYASKLLADPNHFEEYRTRNFDAKELIDAAITGKPAPVPPGNFQYANTNYVIAGLIVEHLTNQPLSEVLRHQIFLPAGMNHTSYRQHDPNISGPQLRGYVLDPSGATPPEDVTAFTPTMFQGSGAVISTVDDVSRFFDALFEGQLITHESLEEMTAVAGNSTYGLGILKVPVACAPGGFTYGHDGSLFGYSSLSVTTIDGAKQATVAFNAMAVLDADLATTMLDFVEANICD